MYDAMHAVSHEAVPEIARGSSSRMMKATPHRMDCFFAEPRCG